MKTVDYFISTENVWHVFNKTELNCWSLSRLCNPIRVEPEWCSMDEFIAIQTICVLWRHSSLSYVIRLNVGGKINNALQFVIGINRCESLQMLKLGEKKHEQSLQKNVCRSIDLSMDELNKNGFLLWTCISTVNHTH